ncbi:hypothetical protein B0H13DRAFT_2326942 [Mycena leptocephala]|nr:hypothetical protein B0H13DRAFT_2326942 [Mycena leptocephala]
MADLIMLEDVDDPILSGTTIAILAQADDILLISLLAKGLQRRLTALNVWCSRNFIVINMIFQMEDTSEKNGVQHWQPSTAVADDLEALYAQAEIEKLAENKHPRKRKYGVLDTAVGLPPAIAEDSDSQQCTNPRIRCSRRIAESATKPGGCTMALVEPRSGRRSRGSAYAHNETDVAVMGGPETLASRRSKRGVNASRAASLDESGQTADGSGNTNEEQNSGTPFLHISMPQNDGPTSIGFSPFGGIPVFGGSRAPVATVDLEPSESHNALASSALVDHISPFPLATASIPPTPPRNPRFRRAKYAMLATCTNAASPTSTRRAGR